MAVDLDVFPGAGGDTPGDPLPSNGFGTVIAVGFDTNEILIALLADEPGYILDGEGGSYYTFSASALKDVPPVPALVSSLLLGNGLGVLGLVRSGHSKMSRDG